MQIVGCVKKPLQASIFTYGIMLSDQTQQTERNNKKGTSISQRAEEIEKREEYGHWEIDTVVGKRGTNTMLLVLTERKIRQQIIRKIKTKSQYCVVKELDKIERKMGSKKFR